MTTRAPFLARPVIGLALAAMLATGCTAAAESPAPTTPASEAPTFTPSPEPSPTEEPSVEPTPPSSPTAEPSGQPDDSDAIAWDASLEVTVDGLAVRRWPGTSSPLVRAQRWNADQQAWVNTTEEVRLNAGHRISVSLGPIVADGIEWYQVFSYPQPDQAAEEEVRWDADGDGFTDNGWIAIGNGDQAYVEVRDLEPDPHAIPPLAFLAGGSGSHQSEPFTTDYIVTGDAALYTTGGEAPCNLEVTVQPTGQVLYSTSLTGVVTVEHFGSSDAADALPQGEYTLNVTAGVPNNPNAECSWAIVLFEAQG